MSTRSIEPFVLDVESSTLLLGDTALPVGKRAVSILLALINQAGRPLNKDQLIELAWGGRAVEDSNLSVQIAALRKALGRVPGGEQWIETLPRRGYRFIGPSKTSESDGGPAQMREGPAGLSDWRVGRAEEMRAAGDIAREAAGGRRQTLFITGEAGIGKSTLTGMIMQTLARNGTKLLVAHCTERFGTDGGFAPLIDALAHRCRQADSAQLLDALRSLAPTWLMQLPHLIEKGRAKEFANEVFGATRERMLREFGEVLDAVSGKEPWALILEDVHWADFATLDVLSRLARSTEPARLIIIATYRPEAAGPEHPLQRLHRGLEVRGHSRSIRLGSLSTGDVEDSLAARFEDAGLANRLAKGIFERSGGHPLFMTSLIENLISERIIAEDGGRWKLQTPEALFGEMLPSSLATMIAQEISRLSREDQQLLEAAAIGGSEFAAALVAAALERDVLDVELAFENLMTRSPMLRTLGLSQWPDSTISTHLAFMHALYQAVLYERISVGRRALLHRRMGDRLRLAYGDATAPVSATLAFHAERGHDVPNALKFLAQAAEVSVRQLRFDDANKYLTRALALLDRLDRKQSLEARLSFLRQRSWVRRSLGNLSGSVADLEALIKEAADNGLLRTEINGLLSVSRFCVHSDRRLCLESSREAFARSHLLQDEDFRVLAQGISASTNLYFNGWSKEDVELCERALQITAGTKDGGILLRRCAIEGILECWRSNYDACTAAGALGKGLAREAGDVYVYVIFNILEMTGLLHMGEWRRLLSEAQEALSIARKNANQHAMALCNLKMAWLSVEALDYRGGLALCDLVDDALGDENPFIFFFQGAVRAKAHVGLNDPEPATAYFSAIAERVAREGIDLDFTIYTQLYHCLGEHALLLGELDGARKRARQLEAYAAPAPDRTHLAIAQALNARVALVEGDLPAARNHIEQALLTVGNLRLPLASRRVHQAAAAIYAAIGEVAMSEIHRSLCQTILQGLAEEFDADDSRRATLIAAAGI